MKQFTELVAEAIDLFLKVYLYVMVILVLHQIHKYMSFVTGMLP